MTAPSSTLDDDLERNLAVARKLVWVPAVSLGVPLIVLAVVVAVLGLVLPAIVLVIAGVAVALSLGRLQRDRAPRLALQSTSSRAVGEGDEPRLHNLVDGLCVGIGLDPPRLHVIEDSAPNALAIARAVDDADLVVTRGLLDALSRVELEAVLAHELTRIRRGDAVVGTLAWPALATPPFSLALPVTRALVAGGEAVETWTDLAAVDITRYPPALAAALEKLAAAPSAVPAGDPPFVAHLWIHGARAEGAFGGALRRVYEPAPSTEQRIEVLQEL